MQLVTFGIDKDMNCGYSVHSIHTTIHAETFNFTSTRNSSSPSIG